MTQINHLSVFLALCFTQCRVVHCALFFFIIYSWHVTRNMHQADDHQMIAHRLMMLCAQGLHIHVVLQSIVKSRDGFYLCYVTFLFTL